MMVLGYSLLSLSVSVVVHILLQRYQIPKRQLQTVFFIFGVVFLSSLSMLLFLNLTQRIYLEPIDIMYFVVIFLLSTLSYAITYTAIEGDSPSFTILLYAEQLKGKGFQLEQCQMLIGTQLFIEKRMQGLIRDGWVKKRGELLFLTAKGIRMLKFFSWARSLLGLAEKGG